MGMYGNSAGEKGNAAYDAAFPFILMISNKQKYLLSYCACLRSFSYLLVIPYLFFGNISVFGRCNESGKETKFRKRFINRVLAR